MTEASDKALADSVSKLNDTAVSLTALIQIVDHNQKLLLKTSASTMENTDAIALSSTKDELIAEVDRLALERKVDRFRTKVTVIVSFGISLLLIAITIFTKNEYKNARTDSSLAYATSAKNLCLQRSETQNAMQKWIKLQQSFLKAEPNPTKGLLPVRLAAYDELLTHFPDVNCNIGTH